jgi:hypothetical protein
MVSALSSPFINPGEVVDFEEKGYTRSGRSGLYECSPLLVLVVWFGKGSQEQVAHTHD